LNILIFSYYDDLSAIQGAVRVATGLHAGRYGSSNPYRDKIFFCQNDQTHPFSYSEVVVVFSVLKRPGREIDLSSLCSADIKNKWSLTSTPLHAITASVDSQFE
jgi:hypothetical protein